MALSDAKIRNLKPTVKTQKLSDGEGLYIEVAPSGSKLWRCAYRWLGKQRTAAFGAYPYTSLAQAREKRTELKTKLAAGLGPSAPDPEIAPLHPFNEVAHEWFKANKAKWVTGYASRIWSRLEEDIFPSLGEKDVANIRPSEVLAALRIIEGRGALELAKRVRQSISQVFRFAIANDYCTADPSAPLADAMQARPQQKHRTALPLDQMPEFFKNLKEYSGNRTTALGLRLIVYTALRTRELIEAKWDEIDGEILRIPAERMKMKRDHVVPLSKSVLATLEELRTLTGGSGFLLPGIDPRKPVSTNTLIFALYRAGWHSRATVHGFRGTFSTAANESGLFRSDVIERQLAHVPNDQVRSAYNSAQYMDERITLMNWWSDQLDAAEAASNPHDLSQLLN